MPDDKPSVLLADDHPMMVQGLSKLLAPSFRVSRVVRNGRALLEAALEERPDVVVTDITMPELDGIEATRQLKERDPDARVVVLSVHTEPAWVRQAFDAGAAAYVPKSAAPEELEQALREVLAGHVYVSPAVARAVVGAAPTAGAAPPTRVLVVDDNPAVRLGNKLFLRQSEDFEVVGEAEDGRQAVERTAELAPDVVLMDLMMPQMDGVAATREILGRPAAPRVLIMTALGENDQMVLAAIRAGAVGYLSKTARSEELRAAVRRAQAGDTVLPPALARRLEEAPAAAETLTPREMEITRLVVECLSNKEIAGHLHLSVTTVRTHLSHIFHKLELDSRVELAIYALSTGWAELPARS